MNRRRILADWLALTVSASVVLPLAAFVATVARMYALGDKPAATGSELERIQNVQWAFQVATYFVCVAIYAFAAVLFLRRK
ncbi:MAG: hypothetical protein JSS36_00780 [Proteobacteria bacterium]|nr:hypothetical protein [Pseudomonadota bacterium]